MQDQLFSSLMCFYANDSFKERFTDLVSHRTKLSQREIDWFATNTSKSENVSVLGMNIYQSYRNQLKVYGKRYFDPFRRRERINVFSGKYRISTTLGQMNFYRWIISNDLDIYLLGKIFDAKVFITKIIAKVVTQIKRDEAAIIIQRRWRHHFYHPDNTRTMVKLSQHFRTLQV